MGDDEGSVPDLLGTVLHPVRPAEPHSPGAAAPEPGIEDATGEEPEALRRQTGSQLIMLAETITSGGLDYYTKKDTHPGSADPGGLFNDGISRHGQITNQLEAKLADDGARLHDSPTDVKEALGNIGKIGEYGGQIGGIMGGLEDVKNSENLFQTTKNVGNLAGKLGPVLGTLGLLVFAE